MATKRKTSKKSKREGAVTFDGDVFAWCEEHDNHAAEAWLGLLLDGSISLDEMRAAVLENRAPRESAPEVES